MKSASSREELLPSTIPYLLPSAGTFGLSRTGFCTDGTTDLFSSSSSTMELLKLPVESNVSLLSTRGGPFRRLKLNWTTSLPKWGRSSSPGESKRSFVSFLRECQTYW